MEEHLEHHELTRSIIGAFFEVHRVFGWGLLEALYAESLERELRGRGHSVSREHAIQVRYKGEPVGFQRLDMVVDSVVIVEIKSTPTIHPMFRRQLINYLNATGLRVGLLLHFGPVPKAYRLFGRSPDGDPGSIK